MGMWRCQHGSQGSVSTQDPTVPRSFQDLMESQIRPMNLGFLSFFSSSSLSSSSFLLFPPLKFHPEDITQVPLLSVLKMENKAKWETWSVEVTGLRLPLSKRQESDSVHLLALSYGFLSLHLVVSESLGQLQQRPFMSVGWCARKSISIWPWAPAWKYIFILE